MSHLKPSRFYRDDLLILPDTTPAYLPSLPLWQASKGLAPSGKIMHENKEHLCIGNGGDYALFPLPLQKCVTCKCACRAHTSGLNNHRILPSWKVTHVWKVHFFLILLSVNTGGSSNRRPSLCASKETFNENSEPSIIICYFGRTVNRTVHYRRMGEKGG